MPGNGLLRTKSVEQSIADTDEDRQEAELEAKAEQSERVGDEDAERGATDGRPAGPARPPLLEFTRPERPTELPGCVRQSPDSNPNSSLFRIEVIRVPLANPQQAAVIGGARFLDSLAPPPQHGEAPEDIVRMKPASLTTCIPAALLCATAIGNAFAADPVRIGVVTPLTGTYAGIGQQVRWGLDLAASEINGAGVIVIEEEEADDTSRQDHYP